MFSGTFVEPNKLRPGAMYCWEKGNVSQLVKKGKINFGTHHTDLDSTHNVHSTRERGSDVEENSHSSAKLRTQTS
jgi:hypothetical protein